MVQQLSHAAAKVSNDASRVLDDDDLRGAPEVRNAFTKNRLLIMGMSFLAACRTCLSRPGKSCRRLFMPLDMRALALGRICLGLWNLKFIWHEYWIRGLFLSDEGLCPRGSVINKAWVNTFSLYYAAGSDIALTALMVLHAAVACSFLVGHRTRLSTAALWVLSHSLWVKNFCTSYSGDILQTNWLMWCIFMPLGEAWSLDAYCRDRLHAKLASARDTPSDVETGLGTPAPHPADASRAAAAPADDDAPAHMALWRGQLLLFQLAILYYSTGATKSGNYWKEGKAVEKVLWIAMAVDPWRRVLLAFKPVLPFFAHATLVAELYGWALLYVPLERVRLATVLLFMQLHGGMHFALDAHEFQPLMISILCMFLPPMAMDFLERRVARARSRLSRALSARRRALLVDVVDAACVPPPPWPSALSPGAWRRLALGRVCARWLVTGLLWGLVAVAVVPSNCQTIRGLNGACPVSYPIPAWVQPLVDTLGLSQNWRMFAPNPPGGWWLTMPALLNDGRVKELLYDGVLDFEPDRGVPYDEAAVLPPKRWPAMLSHRLFKYFEHPSYDYLLGSFGTHVCRKWNGRHRGPDALTGFIVVSLSVPIEDLGAESRRVFPRVMSFHWCSDQKHEIIQQARFVNLTKYKW